MSSSPAHTSSPLEERVSCELVSGSQISCYQGKYREFQRFGPRWRVTGGQNGNQISALRANSLRVRTGKFLTPYRELNRAIRELFTVMNAGGALRRKFHFPRCRFLVLFDRRNHCCPSLPLQCYPQERLEPGSEHPRSEAAQEALAMPQPVPPDDQAAGDYRDPYQELTGASMTECPAS